MGSLSARRGSFLSILVCAFGGAVFAASLVLVLDRNVSTLLSPLPRWFNGYVLALLVVRVAALVGVWNLKRLALYVLLAMEIVEITMGLFVFTSFLTFGQRLAFGAPAFLVLLGIWCIAVRPRWASFT